MPPEPSVLVRVRNGFFAGAILVAPLVVTVWAFSRIIDLVGGTFRPVFFFYLPEAVRNNPNLELGWDILATLLVIITVTCLGLISRIFFAKLFLGTAERLIQGIPGIGAVYNTVKQVVDTFGKQNRSLYNKVVLIEFPRKGSWTMGFLTNKVQGEPQQRTGEDLWTIYVPTTPNPTGGYMVMIPAKDVIELDMTVGDGMKMLLSAGAFIPPWTKSSSNESLK
jgi:uncharacterized membrane protein